VDEQWLREWAVGEAEYPPKTLREDVGTLLAEVAVLRAVAVYAQEYRRLTANGPYQHAGRRLDDALHLLAEHDGNLSAAIRALPAEALAARAQPTDQET
jgi:hypothetical protein